MNNQLIDYKENLLKFYDKEKQWKKDIFVEVESEKTMKEKFEEMERKLQEKEKELELRIIPCVDESNEKSIVQDMSQVNLKDLELTGVKNENKILENLAVHRLT